MTYALLNHVIMEERVIILVIMNIDAYVQKNMKAQDVKRVTGISKKAYFFFIVKLPWIMNLIKSQIYLKPTAMVQVGIR
jgi:hypothetical protein